MKNPQIPSLLLALLLTVSTVTAQAEYPSFNQSYWESEQDIAQGKINRGAGLGIAGVLLLWPTAVMISRSKENPHKYVPLSIVFGAASIGAMAHGFSSISSGKEQKANASAWVQSYTDTPDSVTLEEQQEDYIAYAQESAQKTTVFGIYSASIATILLTNGIIQSSRNDADVASDDITTWPYYASGGALLSMGVLAVVKSRKSSSELDNLKSTSTPTLLTRSQFIPFVSVSPKGEAVFGAYYSTSF